MTVAAVERDLLIVGCAVSAGIHAALTSEHLREGTGPGGGFLVATILLGGLVIALTRRLDRTGALLGLTALTLFGLLASYALAVTTGLPALHPDVEPVNGLAFATKAIEAAALLASLQLLRREWQTHQHQLKGTLT